jgi:hypothetical protein
MKIHLNRYCGSISKSRTSNVCNGRTCNIPVRRPRTITPVSGIKKEQEWQPPPPQYGRELMGNAEKDHPLRWTVVAHLHSLFGTSPILCTLLWGGGLLILVMPQCQGLPGPSIYIGQFATIGTKTLDTTVTGADDKMLTRKWVWLFGNAISSLHAKIILCDNRFNGATGLLPNHMVSVDGTHCPTRRLVHFGPVGNPLRQEELQFVMKFAFPFHTRPHHLGEWSFPGRRLARSRNF